MLRNLFIGAAAFVIVAGSAGVAKAGPKEDVQAAAKKLADADNYSWTQQTESGQFNNESKGKTQKGGLTWVSFSFGDNTTEIVRKGEKGAVKTPDGWKTFEELEQNAGDQPDPGRFMGRMARNLRAPAEQAVEVAGKVKDLKESNGAWAGDLTEEGAKELMAFGGRGGRRGGGQGGQGGQGPEIKNAKGTAKFWVKDGVLSKVEYKVEGTMNFQGEDRDISRTTTVEIKDVGTTKIDVPSEIKGKLTA
jgi:hypothetical protein